MPLSDRLLLAEAAIAALSLMAGSALGQFAYLLLRGAAQPLARKLALFAGWARSRFFLLGYRLRPIPGFRFLGFVPRRGPMGALVWEGGAYEILLDDSVRLVHIESRHVVYREGRGYRFDSPREAARYLAEHPELAAGFP